MEAYCVKCKQKRPMEKAEATFTSTGTPATRGVCAVCGTNQFRMGRTEAHEGLDPPKIDPEVRKRKKRARAERKRSGQLVIVESPAKARTIGRYLGKGVRVRASIGHVRDLLRSKLSVDVENEFQPKYRVPNEKRDVVKKLRKEAAAAKEVIIATDPDREGEAIAWHLMEAAKIDDDRAKRVVFHEITKEAIDNAFDNPRGINMHLVDAQQARRILDRLVGYKLSPLLWAKVRSRLSAGRVQSVALRMVVEREKEIQDFVPEEYWSIDGEFIAPEKPPKFRARLVRVNGKSFELGTEEEVELLVERLREATYKTEQVKRGHRTRKPSAPFTTSTMQQDASRRLKFSARKTMVIAQQLYEGIELASGEQVGLITYMRTDSTQVSRGAQKEARKLIRSRYGESYLPEKPPVYHTKAKKAQEAHEAIRPTSVAKAPEKLKGDLSRDQFRLYQLIWKRFIASQMKPALYDTLVIRIRGDFSDAWYRFRVSASSLKFPGFLKVYEEWRSKRKEGQDLEALMDRLPDLQRGDPLNLIELFPTQHFTQPPARYSDASLVQALEKFGIGRPSTYAPIISTLKQRGYVVRRRRRLEPTEIGELVTKLLVEHFGGVVDYGFTARMEDELDDIADGDRAWVDVVKEFYEPFAEQLALAKVEMPEVKAEPQELDRKCPECGQTLVIRHGRYGKFIGCSNFPDCRHTEPWLEKIGVTCPDCDGSIVERRTRRGRLFYGCDNYPDCEFTSWKRPLEQACPLCEGLLVADNRDYAKCISCETRFPHEEIMEQESSVA